MADVATMTRKLDLEMHGLHHIAMIVFSERRKKLKQDWLLLVHKSDFAKKEKMEVIATALKDMKRHSRRVYTSIAGFEEGMAQYHSLAARTLEDFEDPHMQEKQNLLKDLEVLETDEQHTREQHIWDSMELMWPTGKAYTTLQSLLEVVGKHDEKQTLLTIIKGTPFTSPDYDKGSHFAREAFTNALINLHITHVHSLQSGTRVDHNQMMIENIVAQLRVLVAAFPGRFPRLP